MSISEVKSHIFRNTAVNYFFLVIKMIIAFFLFRLLYQSFSKEEFGFWAIIWSLIGYGKFFDFGIGFTTQKFIAETTAKNKAKEITPTISTIFFIYIFSAIAFLTFTIPASYFLLLGLKISSENFYLFQKLTYLFLCAIALNFPLGIYSEILWGKQLIRIVNIIDGILSLIHFALVYFVISYGGGIFQVLLLSIASFLGKSIIAGIYTTYYFPETRIQLSKAHFKYFKKLFHFSGVVYLNMVAQVIYMSLDRLLIGFLLGITFVPFYQIGARMKEMLQSFSQQLSDTLSPAAAFLNGKDDYSQKKKLFLLTARYNSLIATPLYLITLFFTPDIIRLLTGLKTIPYNTLLTTYLLCFSGYQYIITHKHLERLFIMWGYEKKILLLNTIELFLFFSLASFFLYYLKNITGCALANFIACLSIGYGGFVHFALKAMSSSWKDFFSRCLFPGIKASLPLIFLLTLFKSTAFISSNPNFALLFLELFIALLSAFLGIWFLSLSSLEKKSFKKLLKNK